MRSRSRKRKPLNPLDRGVVGYIRTLNKSLLLPVPMLALHFLTPEIHNFSKPIQSVICYL